MYWTPALSRWTPLLLLGVAAIGCGSNDYAPVSGVVSYNGEPFAGATVTFSPQGDKTGRLSVGETDSNGRYELTTRGSEQHPGAKVGTNRVMITAWDVDTGALQGDNASGGSIAQINARAPKLRSLLPAKYQSFEGSGLTYEVEPGGANEADFDLTD